MKKKITIAQRLSDKTVKHYSPVRALCVLVICTAFLAATGFLIAIPAYQANMQSYYSSTEALRKVGFNVAFLLICGILVFLVKDKNHKEIAIGFTVLGLILMFWMTAGGSQSFRGTLWCQIGNFYFQPSHVLIIAQILILAYLIEEKQKSDSNIKWIVYMWIFTVLFAAYAYCIAYDFHHTLAILAIGFLLSMLFNGYAFEHIAVVVFAVIMVAFCIILDAWGNPDFLSFRMTRIDAWLHPDQYQYDYAYIAVTSLNAIRSGGWFGVGYGNLDLIEALPESYSTNIFALICYEMGWLFAGLIILVYILLSIEIFRVFHSELNRKRQYSAAIVLGVFVYITYEYALCILSTLNLLPDVTRYLPFISYSGPWIIMLTVMIALVLRITIRQIKDDKADTKISNISVEI